MEETSTAAGRRPGSWQRQGGRHRWWEGAGGEALREAVSAPEPGWVAVQGPLGSGKSSLLASVLAERPAVCLQVSPLSDGDLLDDFRGVLEEALGELPLPTGPGVLPDPDGRPGWRSLLLGLVDRASAHGRPLVLGLDGWEALVSARRKITSELAEALERAHGRGAPLRVVLTLESSGGDGGVEGLPPPAAVVRVGPLPLRDAGRAQGGKDARDAFLRWACLGDHPDHLPTGDPGSDWEEALLRRVLSPGGDLHDAPLRRLAMAFQRPERYGSLLRALAHGPLDWAELRRRTRGIESGGQMAPYLRRLEEVGMARTLRPLGAPAGSRNRRYRLTDPFLAFWFSSVLPVRSHLLTESPEEVWARRVRPRLAGHLARWLPVAAAQWFARHAAERFPAAGRQVGGFWGGETEFQVVSWLTNGQICYVATVWSEGPVGAQAFDDLKRRMKRTRYGIGREARTPVLVIPGGMDEELRRRIGADPLATALELTDLMGSSFGDGG